MAPRFDRVRTFVAAFGVLTERQLDDRTIKAEGGALLAELVRHDDWLPPKFAAPSSERYQQYLLHCDSRARFCVVSFVWGPGQSTPIHNHTVWGLVGMLRGSENSQSYVLAHGVPIANGPAKQLLPGDVEVLSPTVGDIHQVSNALADQPSVSIHVYGANIGAVRRSVFATNGKVTEFISTYDNDVLPNIWG